MTFPEMLSHAKKAGFDFLEISVDETDARLSRLDWTEEQRRALRRTIEEVNLPISSMCLSGHVSVSGLSSAETGPLLMRKKQMQSGEKPKEE